MGLSNFLKLSLMTVLLLNITACDKLSIRGVELSGDSCSGTPFNGGSGTMLDPYQVCSRVQFDRVGLPAYSAFNFIVTANIDYAPGGVADAMAGFSGDLDGNGFTIKNFVSGHPGGGSASGGLFTTASGKIHNLKLDNFQVDSKFATFGALAGTFTGIAEDITITNSTIVSTAGESEVGGLFGLTNAATLNRLTLTNITVATDGHIAHAGNPDKCLQMAGISCAGGITGLSSSSTYTDCVVNGVSIVAGLLPSTGFIGGAVGGLIGAAKNTEITTSSSTADVYGSEVVGGLAGAFQGSTLHSINSSHATGSVNFYYSSLVAGVDMDADAIPDVGRTGGLVGHLGSAAINNSYATGNVRPITRAFLLSIASTLPLPAPMVSVTSMDPRIGGLVGGLNNNNVIAGGGVIDNSYSTGTVLGGMDVGGLVGHSSDGTITKSYSSSTSVMGDQDVGGLVGELITTMVFKSYANSTTNGQQYTGGLIGSFNDSVISLSYASGAVSGSLAGSGTGGLVGNLEGGTAMTPTSATIADSFATGNVSGGFRVSGLVGGIAPFTTGSIQRAYAFQSSIVGADVATLLALVGENASGGMGFSGLFYNDALLFLPQPVSDSLGDNKTLASLLGAPGTAYLTGKGFTFGAGAWKSQNTILPYLDWMP